MGRASVSCLAVVDVESDITGTTAASIKAEDKLGEADVKEAEQDCQARALGGGYQLHLQRDWVARREAFEGVQAIPAKISLNAQCWMSSSQKLTPQTWCLEDLRP